MEFGELFFWGRVAFSERRWPQIGKRSAISDEKGRLCYMLGEFLRAGILFISLWCCIFLFENNIKQHLCCLKMLFSVFLLRLSWIKAFIFDKTGFLCNIVLIENKKNNIRVVKKCLNNPGRPDEAPVVAFLCFQYQSLRQVGSPTQSLSSHARMLDCLCIGCIGGCIF